MNYLYKIDQTSWKKTNGDPIANVAQYVLDYVKVNPTTQIHIGTDSQYLSKHRKLKYVSVIAFRDTKNGAHFIINQEKLKLVKVSTKVKLWNEVCRTVSIADLLYSNNIPYSDLILELDLNPLEKYSVSNSLYKMSYGWCKGLGCKVIAKYEGLIAVKAANQYCQRGKR